MERDLCILAIDDEQIVLDSVVKHLRKRECKVFTVLSVAEALEVMDDNQVDIILTDLMMPEIDGLEFLSMMKERSPHTPVIMITGYATISTALEATNLGAFDYIAKPFTRSELLTVVDRAAELVRAAEARATGDGADEQPPHETAAGRGGGSTAGEYGWKRLEDDGTIVLGVAAEFLAKVGRIQNIFLPSQGDELRQGSVFLRIFSSDLRSHTVLSPFSGIVVEVNDKYVSQPEKLADASSQEWLIKLQPSKFEFEIKELGP